MANIIPGGPQHLPLEPIVGHTPGGPQQHLPIEPVALPPVPAPPVAPEHIAPAVIVDQAPEGGILHGVADMFAKFFVGMSAESLEESFQLYKHKENAGALTKGFELLKAAGRGGALVLGSMLVGLSRAAALVGGVTIGLSITLLAMSTIVGLFWIASSPSSIDSLLIGSTTIAACIAAIPAFLGACCQQCAFQKEGEKIDAKGLFMGTLKQHAANPMNSPSVSGIGSIVGVYVGLLAGSLFLFPAIACMKKH